MKLELFFDYACPYCYRGHENLLGLKDKYPDLDIIWRPCEAHPRPEPAAVHSDLAIQGMCFVRDCRGDLWNYHKLVYEAVFDRKSDISDIHVLAAIAGQCGADKGEFQRALIGNRYKDEVEKGNAYAWEEKNLSAVPSYLSESRFVGSKDGVMVSARKLDVFLAGLSKC